MARTFGIPASELKERMTYAEFIEHKVDYELNPWGDDWEQTDMLLRAQCGKPTHGEDYIPRRRIPIPHLTPEQLAAKINTLFGIDPSQYGGG